MRKSKSRLVPVSVYRGWLLWFLMVTSPVSFVQRNRLKRTYLVLYLVTRKPRTNPHSHLAAALGIDFNSSFFGQPSLLSPGRILMLGTWASNERAAKDWGKFRERLAKADQSRILWREATDQKVVNQHCWACQRETEARLPAVSQPLLFNRANLKNPNADQRGS